MKSRGYYSYIISWYEMTDNGSVVPFREEYFWKWNATLHYRLYLHDKHKLNLGSQVCFHSI